MFKLVGMMFKFLVFIVSSIGNAIAGIAVGVAVTKDKSNEDEE